MFRNEKGFTLLEIIISMTILSVGILTLVQMFSGGLKQAAQADRYLNGVYLAQQKFSQLELDNFNTDILEGGFGDPQAYRWQLEILPYESPLNIEEARIQIQKISLRVFWEDQGVEKEVRLVSLKTKGETHTASVNQLETSGQGPSSKFKAPPTLTADKLKSPVTP